MRQGNEQEHEDGTSTDEKYYADRGCLFSDGHRNQLSYDVALRPDDRFFGGFGSCSPATTLCSGLRYSLVDPPLVGAEAGAIFNLNAQSVMA